MTGVFFLGICIIYPNGLFNSSCFQVGPWAEDFLSVFGCSVECMHSNYPCSLWYVLECCCYCTFFEVQFLVIAILVWTCLTVFFLGSSSKYYIVTSCICSCFVCYFDSRSAYCYVCDNRSVRCDCGYNEWICARPVTEYFLTVLVTFPSVAVCVVGSLLYISYTLNALATSLDQIIF